MESAGLYNQNLFVANINSRLNGKISLFGSYAWSRARRNTDGVMSSPPDTYSLNGEYGPASTDIRNRGTMGGAISTLGGVRISPLIVLQSGAPFNITTGGDVYGRRCLQLALASRPTPRDPALLQLNTGCSIQIQSPEKVF